MPAPLEIGDLAEIADLTFKRKVAHIYEQPISKARDLVDQWSKEGIASTKKFMEKTADLVLAKFNSVELAFEEAYILPIGGPEQQNLASNGCSRKLRKL